MNLVHRQQLLAPIIVSLSWLGSGEGFTWLTMFLSGADLRANNIAFAAASMLLFILLTRRGLAWIYPEATRAHRDVLSVFILIGTAVALQVLPWSWAISFGDPFGLYALKALVIFGPPLLMPVVVMVHLLGRRTA